MNINDIYYAIQDVNKNMSLSNEIRTFKLSIYQALLYNLNSKNKLFELMKQILEYSKKLEKLSEYQYILNEDLEKNRIQVKGFILESRFITYLKENNIEEFSFEELEKYLNRYIDSSGDTIDEVSTAMKLYPLILKYRDMFLGNYDNVRHYLSNVFEPNLLENKGNLKNKYESILEQIQIMNLNNQIDNRTKENLEELINELFTYYVDNKIKVPIETQIDVNGTKELIA